MEFKVIFKTKLVNQSVIYLPPKDLGLKALDYVRAKLGINLPAERMQEDIKSYREDYLIFFLTEKEARETGLFLDKHTVGVFVPHKFFNRYCYKTVSVERDPKTDEVLKASLVWKVNKKAIKTAWFKAGCPTEWGEE